MSGSQPQASSGLVLGPDGRPCKVCTAFRNWRPQKQRTTSNTNASTNETQRIPDTGAASAAPAKSEEAKAPSEYKHTPNRREFDPVQEYVRPDYCPPDVEQLGHATWTFLHTTAAYYPERPNPIQQSRMRSLLNALPSLYPCGHCADHLGQSMKVNPPDVSGRVPLSLWLCQRHNEVNERLGKRLFDCSKTDERWKDGTPDGSCD
jgi:mitochondrial FAD-linked sulfhydryl oxidase